MKEYKLLVISDDYCDDLYKEGHYQNRMNYHEDEPKFDLTIIEKIDFSIIKDYDFIVIDYGLFGDLDCKGLKEVSKRKNIFVTSAMPESFVRGEGCINEFVDFKIEMMYIDLIRLVKKTHLPSKQRTK